MPDLDGLVVSLPTESVAVRATVGSLIALVLVSLLLRTGLRSTRIRSLAVLAPVLALGGAVALSWGDLLLPFVMTTTDGVSQTPVSLSFLARDTYLDFAAVGWPLLALWVLVASVRVGRRLSFMRRMHLVARGGAPPRDLRVVPTLARLAQRLRIARPRLVVVDGCPGGAVVVGVRQPTVILDARLLADLDDEELEGLLAHELAHLRRRDNLLGLVVGLVRDVCFFVPGGRWVARRLCAERELAADHIAVAATNRPGALASGLLKVIDRSTATVACASFAASATTVGRVERLIADARPLPAWRGLGESALVAGALTLALVGAIQLPATVAASSDLREALALVWPMDDQVRPHPQAAVFAVYQRSVAYEPRLRHGLTRPVADGREFHPVRLRGHEPPDPSVTVLPSQVHPNINAVADADLQRQWQATPVIAADGGVGLYWLGEADLRR